MTANEFDHAVLRDFNQLLIEILTQFPCYLKFILEKNSEFLDLDLKCMEFSNLDHKCDSPNTSTKPRNAG